MSTMAHSQNSTPLTAAWDVHVDSLELIRSRPVLPGVTWIFYSDILASMGGWMDPCPVQLSHLASPTCFSAQVGLGWVWRRRKRRRLAEMGTGLVCEPGLSSTTLKAIRG